MDSFQASTALLSIRHHKEVTFHGEQLESKTPFYRNSGGGEGVGEGGYGT